MGVLLLSSVGIAQKFEWNTGGTPGGSHHWSAAYTGQSGNTVISGRYQSSMNFDTVTRTVASYGQSYYVSMLDSAGKVQYFRNSNTDIKTLALDDNNTYMGIGAYSIVLDHDTIKADTINARVLFAKFNPQMGVIWKKQIKPVNPADQADISCDAFSFDGSGNLYVLASSSSYLDVRLDTAQFNVNGRFLFKFDANGTMLFWRKLNFNNITVMSSDNAGNVWFSGKYNYNSYASNQSIDFGNNVTITNANLTTANHYDLYTARYNSSGVAQWARFTGGNYSTNNTYDIRDIIFDSNNNAVMYGSFWNKIVFFTDTLIGNTSDQYSQNQFITKFSANGTYQWSKTIYDSINLGTYINQIKFGPNDHMYILGEYPYKGFYLGDTNFVHVASSGSSDRYLACFDSDFKYVWSRYLQSGVTNNVSPSLRIIGNGDVFLASASSSFKYGELKPNYGYYWFTEDSTSMGLTGGSPYIMKLSDIPAITTGVASNEKGNTDFVVYPNPASQTIYLNNLYAINYRVEVVSANGEIVKKLNKYNAASGIVVRDLPKGMYFIQLINTQDNTRIIKKIILQ